MYFSPYNHLLGEALALHALGLFFAPLSKAARWEGLGARIMREQMDRQVHADGSHIEQSTYYHVYALDMFLLHAILKKPDRAYLDQLQRMAGFLDALLGPCRSLAFIGDDDGGRLFHPYGARDQFGRATVATAATLLDREPWGGQEQTCIRRPLGGSGSARRLQPKQPSPSRVCFPMPDSQLWFAGGIKSSSTPDHSVQVVGATPMRARSVLWPAAGMKKF